MNFLKPIQKQFERFFSWIGRKFQDYLKKFPLTSTVTAAVLFFHFAVIMTLSIQRKPPINIVPKKLAIHTLVLPLEVSNNIKTTAHSSNPKLHESTQVVKSTQPKKPAPTKHTVKTSTQSQTKKVDDPKRQKILKELQESLTKLEQKPSPTSTKPLHIPKEIKELKATISHINSDGVSDATSHQYEELLVEYLRQILTLPAAGFVKAKLALKSDGSCSHLKILSSDSEVNRLYLEKHLQDLVFPPFSHELEKQESYVFSLTFYGE